MRDIRFRAWDKVNKKMNYGPFWIGNESNEMVTFWDSTFTEAIPCYNQILLQYTGLKDKNGKEIYEGDIIREDFNPHLNIWEIKSKPSYFTAEGKGYRFPLHSLQYPIEVIGNIYENSELLTAYQGQPHKSRE